MQTITICSLYMTIVEYLLCSAKNDLLRKFEVNHSSTELITDKQNFELSLSGFSYADK